MEDGRVAFVTGAGSGIGRAIALRLVAGGMRVAVADVDEEGARTTSDMASSRGAEAIALTCDVTDRDSVDRAAQWVQTRWGTVDVLVNNAGYDVVQLFLDTEPGQWERIISVNLVGVLTCTHVLAPIIVERCGVTGYGRIVNISSDAARVGSMGESVYSATKGGIVSFSKTLARELARAGVTVNVVCPGPADTPMMRELKQTEVGAKILDRVAAAVPFKRLAKPEEVAGAVAYFASEDAGFVTGQVLSVSGGLTMAG